MARTNTPVAPRAPIHTHEGAPAAHINHEQQLRRLSLATLLWEDQFYVDGKTIAQAIADTIPHVKPERIASLAVEAREKQKLRHLPLLLMRELARYKTDKPGQKRSTTALGSLVGDTLARVIQRPDELAEFLAIYWKDKRQPLSAQVKKGLQRAFAKFDAYQLRKWDRESTIKLRDVMFLVHPKPSGEMAEVYKELASRETKAVNTWETKLSAGEGKKTDEQKQERWTEMLREKNLGALALLRNLRNMMEADVDLDLIREALEHIKVERVLPFRFIAAARYAPKLEPELGQAMLKCLTVQEKLAGRTVLLIDVSGSMGAVISSKSEITRMDAACGVAMLAREICADVDVLTFSDRVKEVPSRHAFALRDAIVSSQPHGGTNLGQAMAYVNGLRQCDRVIVITDEQSHEQVPNPKASKAYMVNVASYQNGVGYGHGWEHIDGWSEACLDYIRELENNA
jgi:hypothetical protein